MPLGDVRVMWILAGEASTARVTGAMRRRGIDTLVLKGVVTERWLYSAGDKRLSSDIDILVAPDRILDAERLMGEMGYVNRFDGPAPDWVDQHGHAWTSADDPLPVDLHRRVWGCWADPGDVWLALWRSRAQLTLGSQSVDVLGPAARTMLAATHVAQHDGKVPSAVEDLRRALAREPQESWVAAAEMAEQCGATSAFVEGLSTLPEGSAIKENLALPDPDPTDRPPPPEVEGLSAGGEGVLRLSRAHGIWDWLRVARREVFPSVRFMRVRSPQSSLARRGPFGLVASYPARWLVIVRALVHARRRGE